MSDDWDDYWAEYGRPLSATLTFGYEDASGNETERTIHLSHFDDHGSIKGYCTLRQENRAFRLDRIIWCRNADTGEVIDSVYDYLFDLYEKTPEHSLDAAFSKWEDAIRAIIYVLHCADQWNAIGHGVVAFFCRTATKDQRLSASLVKTYMQNMPHMDDPGLHAFRMIAGRLAKDNSPKIKASLLSFYNQIAKYSGEPNSSTQEALDYLAKRFAQHST